ncbi:hypothetical protein [Mucilaginibacter gotjawali]|uniref:Uncharacterized protein n=2 Tax=Mucilaginibacter gotjawali TaxID=1550579 RepID=A0A839SGH9_9SPHI|nr:hypothetical protein [Mucilaginibacter gotjawali]MBB3055637.1 hypothetical protein [Mucilaginibacter gotjawali]BAU53078.1 hypothetical protein MgSA37_01245 [Mucilaginibacter gotjawali]
MKKIILSITLLMSAMAGYCQLIKPVKLDSLVTISLPPGYQTKDTLNEHIFTANGMYGYMIAFREANAKNNTPLKTQGDLNKVMKTYIKGIQAQQPGSSAQYVRDTTIGTLKAKTFTLKSDDGNGVITCRNFVLIYTKDVTYTIEYVYPGERTDVVKPEYKAFIASIKLSPELQRNDQYLSNATGMSSTTKIEVFGGAGLVVLIILVLIAVKNKKKEPALG